MHDVKLIDILKNEIGEYPIARTFIQAIKFIFMNYYESMLLVNEKGEIEFLDRGSEKALGLPHGMARGKNISDILPSSDLKNVISSGEPHIGKIIDIHGVQQVILRYPLFHNNKIIGAFGRIIYHSLEELERVRKEARTLQQRVKKAEERLSVQHKATYTLNQINGVSDKIIKAKQLATKLARSDSDVLIYGESGTGKELFAHAIHNASLRSSKPFVKVNCPAIPLEIAEAELFGYDTGAFTGAQKGGKAGKFELAQGGTIFLDEIGSLPMSIQAKLLRVIQEREIERLGSQKLLRLNIRIIAATNVDLKEMAEQGKFRSDLYFRLSKVILQLPPLKDRPEDIPYYVTKFFDILKQRVETKATKISDEVLEILKKYKWEGNVRELINVLEQSFFRAGNSEVILFEHLPDEFQKQENVYESTELSTGSLRNQLDLKEKDIILKILNKCKGNKREAAHQLGIHRSALYVKIKKHGL